MIDMNFFLNVECFLPLVSPGSRQADVLITRMTFFRFLASTIIVNGIH